MVDQILDGAGLPAADVTALRKWRTSLTPGSAAVKALAEKMNADLARMLENKRKSAVLRPDWR